MKTFIALCGALAVMLSGCASIVKSGSQDIAINSLPNGATFEVKNNNGVSGVTTGTTPGNVRLLRGDGYFKSASYTITITKDGYKPQMITLNGSMNGWYIGGNLLFGGLIGYLVVDPLSGAMWTLSPDTVQTGLAPVSEASSEPAPAGGEQSSSGSATMIHVVLAQDVPLEMWKDLRQVR